MKIVETIGRYLAAVERTILVVMLGTMVLLAFLQVILRSIFSIGFLWGDPFLRYLVLWVGFIGATLATHEESHFGIEFLSRFLSPRPLHAVRAFVSLFAAVMASFLTVASVQFLIEGIGAQEVDVFNLPRRLYYGILPAAFGLIALHLVLKVIRHCYLMVRGETQSPGSGETRQAPA